MWNFFHLLPSSYRACNGIFSIDTFAEYLLAAETTSFTSRGVIHIIAYIMINSPSEFPDVIPIIGNFHCTKIVIHNMGKFLQGSGAKETLIECKVFGVKANESVMNVTHVRFLKCLLILEEAIMKMKWSAFCKCNTKERYEITIQHAQKLK